MRKNLLLLITAVLLSMGNTFALIEDSMVDSSLLWRKNSDCSPTTNSNKIVENKHLTLINVINSWLAYDKNVWEKNFSFKENDEMQLLEICIWNIDQPKIALYKFDRTFDPYRPDIFYGGALWVEYRESFNVLDLEIPEMTSSYVLWAFKQIAEKIVEVSPANHYGLKYLGHGSVVQGLFENKLNIPDSKIFLDYFCTLLGKKIDFLDWNTNCQVGTYENIETYYQYADYVLASDLNRGGKKNTNGDPLECYFNFEHTQKIETFFSPLTSIRQSLVNMVNSEKMYWECLFIGKNSIFENPEMEAISIFDCNKFENLVNATKLNHTLYTGDVLNYVQNNYPEKVDLFYDFRFHYVNNSDFCNWVGIYNGFKKIYLSHPPGEIVPVTEIINLPSSIKEGGHIILKGTVIPDNATNKTIIWAVHQANNTGAFISDGNILHVTKMGEGDLCIKATIVEGYGWFQNYVLYFWIGVIPGVVIDERTVTTAINVYPNPTTGELRVENSKLRIENVDFFDINGRKIFSAFQEKSINISHLPVGTYFMELSTEIGKVVKKVLKE